MRIGAHAAGTQRTPVSLPTLLRRLRNRIQISVRSSAIERENAQTAVADAVKQRQDQLVEFYRVYEDLVEALCDAAQYGPTPALERTYARSRTWMRENYAPVRRYVIAYLRYATEDAVTSMDHRGEAADAFEALVAAPDLFLFLKHDDGMMISRLERTREALNLYAGHLRQLARV